MKNSSKVVGLTKMVGTALVISLAAALAPANATTFQFKSDGGTFDSPVSNVVMDCGTVGTDFCTENDALGFAYTKDGVEFTVTAYASGVATKLIQDLYPVNSGLGALSEGGFVDDQTQFDSEESVVFEFAEQVRLTNIEFNSGNETDCSAFGASEGPCGDFDLLIDDLFVATITAVDLLTDVFVGTKFEFVAKTVGAGFVIAQIEISDVPIPAAIPLLLSGLAGLGFMTRKKQAAK